MRIRFAINAVWPGLGYACSIIAWALIMIVHVETVLVTGPILLTVGIVGTAFALLCRDRWALACHSAFLGVCLLFFLLVQALNWGPPDAHRPFTIMGFGFVALATPLVVTTWVHRAAADVDTQRCQACGYLLTHLTGDVCPECGTQFDPELVAQDAAK